MDKIIHGLDLPNDISERNNKIVMESLGITEEEVSKTEEIED